MKIVIITNCSKRKKQKAQQSLMAMNLQAASIEHVANEWSQEVMASKGDTLVAREQYVGRSFKEVKIIEKTVEFDWHIISAGLGLISSEKEIPSYDLTITNGSSNSIAQKLSCNSSIADWWAKINEKFNHECFPIAKLLNSNKDSLFLFALTKSYFNLISSELSKINDKSKIRLFGFRDSNNLVESIKKYFLPYDPLKFDGPDSENNGIKNDYPRRVLRHYVEQILCQQKEPNFEQESKLVEEYLSKKTPQKILKNKKYTDDYIIGKIKNYNKADYPTHRILLKHFRHDLNIACEDSRFKALFHEVL